MFKLHECWRLYFGTASANNLGDCQISDMSSDNILNLLGLTNLGTKCEEVVCKYENVCQRTFDLQLQFHFVFCILQVAFDKHEVAC